MQTSQPSLRPTKKNKEKSFAEEIRKTGRRLQEEEKKKRDKARPTHIFRIGQTIDKLWQVREPQTSVEKLLCLVFKLDFAGFIFHHLVKKGS
jgi:predicted transcriptional regulator